MVKGKGTFGDYKNFAYLCNVNKTTIMKTVSYISQVERAISVIRAKNKNFDTYNDVVKFGQIFGLVRLAMKLVPTNRDALAIRDEPKYKLERI